jgi:branched-chain amino acid transport system permease protein
MDLAARTHRWALVTLLLAVLAGVVGIARPAGAEITTNEGVRGFVRNERLDDQGQRVLDPVPGVKITVKAADGTVAGEATTGADGTYEIPLPTGPGTYTIAIDESTLPKGITPAADSPTSRTVEIRPDQILNGNFFVGQDTRTTKSKISRLPQAVFDGLFFGLIIAICAIGLSLIYGATGLSNFAHGEMVTFGAFITWWLNRWMHLVPAALVGIALGVLAGWAFDKGVWLQLRRRRVGLTSQMIASIGLALFFRYVIAYRFGGRSETYRQYGNQEDPITLGSWLQFPPRVFFSLLLCLVVLFAVAWFLLKTRFGKAVRAVSDNPDLASATGINTNRVIAIVWALGGGLAALGGVLLGLDQKVRWDSGFGVLLLMFAAITLGGLGSAFGALVGSLVIGLFVEVFGWFFSSIIELKRVGALLALIVLLLIRPQGLLGRKERIG